MAEVDYMAAEPRVTARDPVKVVGGKDGGGRSNKRERGEEKDREVDGSEGFLFQISPDPQGTSVLVSSSTKKKREFPSKKKFWPFGAFPRPEEAAAQKGQNLIRCSFKSSPDTPTRQAAKSQSDKQN